MSTRLGYTVLCTIGGLAVAVMATCTVDRKNEDAPPLAVASQAITSNATFQITLPRGVEPRAVAAGATGELRINDGVTMAGLATNMGTSTTNIGVLARVGTIQSVANVLLRNGAVVNGNVETEGTLTLSDGASVSGVITQGTDWGPSQKLTITVPFNDGGASVVLAADSTKVLAPGNYGAVSVGPNAKLGLSSGKYLFDSISVEPGGTLDLDQSTGPVYLFVKSTVLFSGKVAVGSSETQPQLLLATCGTQDVTLQTAFHGAVFAPNAKLVLATVTSGGGHAGQFLAKSLEIHQNQTVKYVPFSYWDGIWDALAPNVSCGETGDTGVARLLGNSAAGNALKQLHFAAATQTNPAVFSAALAAVKALPVHDVVSVLSGATAAADESNELWISVYLAASVDHAAIVPVLDALLKRPVPVAYRSNTVNTHDLVQEQRVSVLNRCTAKLAQLISIGIAAARQPLLDVVVHPIRGVRRNAIYRIKQLASVDPTIVADMQTRLVPGDEVFLGVRSSVSTDSSITPSPTNNDYDPSVSVGAVPGNSSGTVVTLPTCTDGTKNQTETDVDCGGGCQQCANGRTCTTNRDCSGGYCVTGACTNSPTGSGPCSEATAVDLGAPGNNVTVPNDACIRVRDAYPSWWSVRAMQLQTTTPGTYPTPFQWSNSCASGAGSATFVQDWQSVFFGPTSSSCATIIKLQGSGTGNVTVRYYGT